MTIEIPLTQGQVAHIDDWNYERVSQHSWHAQKDPRTGKFYAKAWINGKHIYLHRFIMDAPPGMEVDHKDWNGLNCHEDNMRLVTLTNNLKNQNRRSDNTSGYKGVTWDKARGKYQAQIWSDKVKYFLGRFDTAEEAARVYDAKACELHGEFASLNFPDEWRWDAGISEWQRIDEVAK